MLEKYQQQKMQLQLTMHQYLQLQIQKVLVWLISTQFLTRSVQMMQQEEHILDGIPFTTTFVTGGLFSLDGVHPTSRGYGIVANEFIKVINTKWGTSIPLVNVSQIPGSLILAKDEFSWITDIRKRNIRQFVILTKFLIE